MSKTRKRFGKDDFLDYNYVKGQEFRDNNIKRHSKRFDRALKQGNIHGLLELEDDEYQEEE